MASNIRNENQQDDSLTVIQVKKSELVDSNSDRTILVKPISEVNDKAESDITRIQSPKAQSSEVVQNNLDKTRIEKKPTLKSPEIDQNNEPTHTDSEPTKLTVGSTINNRFVLKNILGVGGMGKVYKAIDLRKQEAQDKNPFIAIKVLNDEFREHPESLIALQREARKSQQLSHPNIVNVHDFDRDGDNVYMTMELLCGRSLDEVLAHDYPNGMTESEATPIINAVSNAVLYAHQHGIVHSDLKPSNIFITDDKKAKIFDFGIARACTITKDLVDEYDVKPQGIEQNSIHDATLFDPTQLGALTPTYASLEMLDGHAPEPHDDIYSLACVFYEVLTGLHPYSRLPADEAKIKQLKPKPIQVFKSSQFKGKAKALYKALEFNAKDRYNNLELFINDYNFIKKSKKSAYITLFVFVMSLLLVFFPKLQEQYYFTKQSDFISTVNSDEFLLQDNSFSSITKHVNLLEGKVKDHVLDKIKISWMNLVERKLEHLSSTESNSSHYSDISIWLKILQVHYPDSAKISRYFETLEKQKYIEINLLNSEFNELLEVLQYSELTSSSNEQEKIIDIILRIKSIEKSHPLVQDQRLLLIYQDNIERLLIELNKEEARKLLAKAKIIFPDEIILQNLLDKLKTIKVVVDDDTLQLEDNEEGALPNISELKHQLSSLINNEDNSDNWDKEVTLAYAMLAKKLGRGSIWLNEKNQTLASLYLKKSVLMRDEKRLVESRRFLEKAKEFNNAIYGLEDEEAILHALENIVHVRHKAKQKKAKIEGLKTSLNIQLKAQKMNSALRTYEDLKRILGRNEPFIAIEAKQEIAQTYYKQAKSKFQKKNYSETLQIIDSGLKFEPRHTAMRNLKKKTTKQIKLRENSLLLAQHAAVKKPKTLIKPSVNKKVTHSKLESNDKDSMKSVKADTCKAKFAGYGKRKRANCYDSLPNHIKLPTLVVVPGITSGEKAFAISKYEITVSDYNTYCQQSGECTKKTTSNSLPVTGVSMATAMKYSQWLTKITSMNYSLPTSEQWLHAVKTNKPFTYNDVNCRIKFGSKLIKGNNLLASNTGQSNPWGLMNIIGNAREFVVDNGKTIARGGAYTDPIKECNMQSQKHNLAHGDRFTGFRVVRAIN